MSSSHLYAGSMLIASASGTTKSYVHADALGDTRLVTQAGHGGKATTVFSTNYEPFGVQYSASGTDPSVKYTGQWSEALGLYWNHARFYDPTLGRFVSADPVLGHLSAPQTLDRYAYAVGNPERFEDPIGRDLWGSITGFFGGLVSTSLSVAGSVQSAMTNYAVWSAGASYSQKEAMLLTGFANMGIGIAVGGLQIGSWICGLVSASCGADLAAHAAAGVGWGENGAYSYFLGWFGAGPDPRGASIARTWAPAYQALGPVVLTAGLSGITDAADVAAVADVGNVADTADAAAAADGVPIAAEFPEGLQDGSLIPFSRVPGIIRAYLGDDSEFTSLGQNLKWTTETGDVLNQARLGYGEVEGFGGTLRLVLEQYVLGARTDVAHIAVFLD